MSQCPTDNQNVTLDVSKSLAEPHHPLLILFLSYPKLWDPSLDWAGVIFIVKLIHVVTYETVP